MTIGMHRTFNLARALIISGVLGNTATGQVYDWSLVHSGTQSLSTLGLPDYGPRNHIAGGSFNSCSFLGGQSGFSSCGAADFATWYPGVSHFDGPNLHPSQPFTGNAIDWPYMFRWYCSFDAKYGFTHPANFYAGVISVRLYEVVDDSHARYNYMLFELMQPLDMGVPYVFGGSLAAATPTSMPATPHLERIGIALLRDLPVPDSSFAFLDSITPLLTTPPGVLLGATTTTLADTLIGNGERFLLVGLFDPIDSLEVSEPATVGGGYEYVLEDFFLVRRDCGYANAFFQYPVASNCRSGTQMVYPANYGDLAPEPEWWLNGVLQEGSSGTTLNVLYGGTPETDVMLVVDTGACLDTAHYTILWKGMDPALTDTFTVCGQPMVIDVDTVLHHVSASQVEVDWHQLNGSFNVYDAPDLDMTLPGPGTYALYINMGGCVQHDTLIVGPDRPLVDTTLVGDPVLLAEISPEHCVNMNDGGVELHDMGYPGTLHYDWYDTPLAGVDTNHANGLTSGTWHVRVRDDQYRCTASEHTVPQWLDLCAMIRGTVYEDTDLDCLQESVEAGHPLRTVLARPVGNVAVTDPDGTYELLVPPGSHTVEAVYADPYIGNNCGNGVVVSVPIAGAVANNVDIGDTTHIPVHDLAILYGLGVNWVTGSTSYTQVTVKNTGELPEAVVLRVHLEHPTMVLDTVLLGADYLGMGGDTLLAELGVLQPGELRTVHLSCVVPPDPLLLTTVVYLHFDAVPVTGETNVVDNVFQLDFEVMGSYDPNDKLVTPYGDPEFHGLDTTVHRLCYTIRFQNTGNYPATVVRLEDELSPLLVPQSLRVRGASHAMQAFSFGSTLYFVFPSIMLPDSTSDPQGSMGWVQFTLDVDPGVQYGDSILNRGAIYFDQNPPITTPSAITRFLEPLASGVPNTAHVAPPQRFKLVPNPVEEHVVVVDTQSGGRILELSLFDAHGTAISNPVAGDRLDLARLAPGLYNVWIRTADGVHTLRLVKH